MTKIRTAYFTIGYLVLLAAMTFFQLRAEASYMGRISTGFMSGAFLLVYGFVSAVVMLLFYGRFNRFEAQIVSSLLAMNLGLWTILLNGAQVAYYTIRSAEIVMRLCQALSVPLMYLYLGLKPGRMKRRLFRLSAVFCSAISLGLVVLPARLSSLPFLALAAGALWFAAKDVLKEAGKESMFSTASLFLYGVCGLGVLMLLNGLKMLLDAYDLFTGPYFMQFVYPFGASVYLMAVTFAFSIFVSESYAKYDENALLFHAAYGDPLTGLSNRAAWDEKMKEIDEQPESYCIISLDLDGLKGVNDTWGHEAGDRLITGFARCLADAFTEPHFLARIGGDEFCVIMQDATEEEVKKHLRSLDTRLGVLNRRDKEVNHSCSYGYAFRDEEKGGAHEIYLEADEKMYATKQMHKAQRKADALTKMDSNETKVAQMVQDALAALNPGEQAVKPEEAAPASAAEAFRAANGIAQQTPPAGTAPAPAAASQSPRGTPAASPRMKESRALRSARVSREQQALRALEQIQDTEIRNVSKQVAMKKALKLLEEVQAKQAQPASQTKPAQPAGQTPDKKA